MPQMHCIMSSGVESLERRSFLAMLTGMIFSIVSEIFSAETKTSCYAWALIPNHFHLLLRTGTAPLSSVMRRLLTGYAVSYNLRHHRYGHLFQNRYKSILLRGGALSAGTGPLHPPKPPEGKIGERV